MKLRSTVLFAALLLVLPATAQEPAEKSQIEPVVVESVERVKLFDAAEDSSQSENFESPQQPTLTAKSLRQARALYESEQRIKRIEANRWIGHEPLRPNWSMVPVMTSRYQSRRTIYVPLYIYSR